MDFMANELKANRSPANIIAHKDKSLKNNKAK